MTALAQAAPPAQASGPAQAQARMQMPSGAAAAVTGVRVRVVHAAGGPTAAGGAAACGRVAALLRQAGIEPVTGPGAPDEPAAAPAAGPGTARPDAVTVAVTATVEEAVALCSGPGDRLLAVCDTVSPSGLRDALRAGVRAVLRSPDLTPPQLAAAVYGAWHGDSRVPYSALVQLLGGARAADPPRLTPRQHSVLSLMAEGHGNAVIAQTLSCSPHTVKNTVYELMGRLQARTRAQAVACAVRWSII
ncbi:LuxR C-terminal-related transcriptional regulator [Streptomyces sp. NPDC050585]|uniref:helix-turn-helix transcriptional regulator n=1 Tax=Streptomyces sp. NPDC050585 TaxID=3365632 RepID=UPI0037981F5B